MCVPGHVQCQISHNSENLPFYCHILKFYISKSKFFLHPLLWFIVEQCHFFCASKLALFSTVSFLPSVILNKFEGKNICLAMLLYSPTNLMNLQHWHFCLVKIVLFKINLKKIKIEGLSKLGKEKFMMTKVSG